MSNDYFVYHSLVFDKETMLFLKWLLCESKRKLLMILVHLCAFPKGGQVNCKISFFPTLLLPGEVVTHFLNQLQF